MNKEDELYAELFKDTGGIKNMNTVDSLALKTSIYLTRRQMEFTFIVRSVVSIMARLSIIISVWVFLFRPDLWYGILLFTILALIFGGIADRSLPSKMK